MTTRQPCTGDIALTQLLMARSSVLMILRVKGMVRVAGGMDGSGIRRNTQMMRMGIKVSCTGNM